MRGIALPFPAVILEGGVSIANISFKLKLLLGLIQTLSCSQKESTIEFVDDTRYQEA